MYCSCLINWLLERLRHLSTSLWVFWITLGLWLSLRKAKMSLGIPDCTPKCRSVRHAEEVIAALTSGSEGSLRGYLSVHCHNAATLRDEFGRTPVHLAASLGKRDLLQWLLDCKRADLLAKDKESGWTALHRSAFYGQIHCLMTLIKVRTGSLIWVFH